MPVERRAPPPDAELLSACAALLALGLVAQYSLSAADTPPSSHFARQAMFAAVGAGLLAALRPVSLSWWRKSAGALMALALALMALTLMVGAKRNGATRWLDLGFFTLQPGEFAKLALILFLAKYCARNAPFHSGGKLLAPLLPWVGALAAILTLQPDFGGLCLAMAVVCAILFFAGLRMTWALGLLFAVGAMAAALVASAPYRVQRLMIFLDPRSDIYGAGYNQWHSLMAFESGGLWGRGLGRGLEKWGHLPEAHNDFVAAALAEEIGFFGFAGMVALFAFIVMRAVVVGREAAARGEMFGAFYAFGFAAAVTAQVTVNLAGNLALGPAKGFTLPLVSYGGSSLLATAAMVAVLMRVDFENRSAKRAAR